MGYLFFYLAGVEDLSRVFGTAALILAAVIGAIYGTIQGIKKFRANSIAAKRIEEDMTSTRVNQAIQLVKEENRKQIDLSQQLADGYKNIMELAQRENQFLKADLAGCRERQTHFEEELGKANAKRDEVAELFIAAQGTIKRNVTRIAALDQEVVLLRDKLTGKTDA